MAYKFTQCDRDASLAMCEEVDLLRQEKSRLLQSIKYCRGRCTKTDDAKEVKIDGMETRLRDIGEEERVKFDSA